MMTVEGALTLPSELSRLPRRPVIAVGAGPVGLRVAEITLSIVTSDPRVRLGIPSIAGPFSFSPVDSPDVAIEVAMVDRIPEPRGEQLFNSGALWRLYRTEDGYALRLGIPRLYPEAYQLAEFDSNFTRGRVLLSEEFFPPFQSEYPLRWPLDELIVLQRLGQGEGVEVHGCGLIDRQGEGHLFLGQSGAGKSTTARLWRRSNGATVLSDDRLILRMQEGELRMYGTPWDHSGRLAAPASAPLKRIFFLQHAPENELTRLCMTETTSRLMACCFVAFHDPQVLARALEFFHQIAIRTPCYLFGFRPDETAVETILRHVENQG